MMQTNSNRFFTVACLIILFFTARGEWGNIDLDNKAATPIQFSTLQQHARFALTYNLAENHTVYLSSGAAHFADLDVGVSNGKFVSLVNPGSSFIFLPAYLIGILLNIGILSVLWFGALVALLNAHLIHKILIREKLPEHIASIAGLVFLFATPAFSYAFSVFQHHLSVSLLLILLLNNRHKSLSFLIYGLAVMIDMPNAIFFLPALLYNLDKKILKLRNIFWLIIPIAFFLIFNQLSYGSPWKLPALSANGYVNGSGQLSYTNESQKAIIWFFKFGQIPKNLFIQFFSLDRGLIFFSPILLFGFWGLFKEKTRLSKNLLWIILINCLLYASYFDGNAGWSFGHRYSIPSFAILSIGIAFFLKHYASNIKLKLLFKITLFYSVFINLMGALTNYTNPPAEYVNYIGGYQGFAYNWHQIISNQSNNFIHNTLFEGKLHLIYYFLFVLLIIYYTFQTIKEQKSD